MEQELRIVHFVELTNIQLRSIHELKEQLAVGLTLERIDYLPVICEGPTSRINLDAKDQDELLNFLKQVEERRSYWQTQSKKAEDAAEEALRINQREDNDWPCKSIKRPVDTDPHFKQWTI